MEIADSLVLAYNQPSWVQAENSDQLSVASRSDVISIFKAFAILFMPASHV